MVFFASSFSVFAFFSAGPAAAAVGGLARSGATWSDSFHRALQRTLPDAHVIEPKLPATHGAALIAARSLGYDASIA